jgi:hypothetical protein
MNQQYLELKKNVEEIKALVVGNASRMPEEVATGVLKRVGKIEGMMADAEREFQQNDGDEPKFVRTNTPHVWQNTSAQSPSFHFSDEAEQIDSVSYGSEELAKAALEDYVKNHIDVQRDGTEQQQQQQQQQQEKAAGSTEQAAQSEQQQQP